MSQLSSRVLLGVALSAVLCACAGDQKSPDSPADEAGEQAPVMKTTPSAGEDNAPAPTGQPAGLPQAEPPPQGLNSDTRNNVLASRPPPERRLSPR